MIKLVKLITGETIIGDVSQTEPFFVIDGPMYLESFQGGMKLRDAMLLTTDENLKFRGSDVITMYEPINLLVVYYHKTLEYCITVDRPDAISQLKDAIVSIETGLQHNEKQSKRLVNILSGSNTNTTVH